MSKTTVKDFQLFKTECRKWIDVFGLKGWECYFRHEKEEDIYVARLSPNVENRTCTFFFAVDWGDSPLSELEIKKTAFHETMELFLTRFRHLALKRDIREAEILEEDHHIIRILENVLFDSFEEN